MKKNRRQTVQLRPGKDFVVIAVILGVGRAAINAPEIATVGHRNPQVGDLTVEFVAKRHKTKNPIPGIADGTGCAPKTCIFSAIALLSKLQSSQGRRERFPSHPGLPIAGSIVPRAVGFLSGRLTESELLVQSTPAAVNEQTTGLILQRKAIIGIC
jgi:hypothetical protein